MNFIIKNLNKPVKFADNLVAPAPNVDAAGGEVADPPPGEGSPFPSMALMLNKLTFTEASEPGLPPLSPKLVGDAGGCCCCSPGKP